MLTEAVTVGIILAGCSLATWVAKTKFQPDIDKRISILEKQDENTIFAKNQN